MKGNKLNLVILLINIFVLLVNCFMAVLYLNTNKNTPEKLEYAEIYGEPSLEVVEVSVIELIANPKVFDGKLVSVQGVLSVGVEDNALYLSKHDFHNYIKNNSVALNLKSDFLDSVRSELDELDGEYVCIQGYFTVNEISEGVYSAQISKITRILHSDVYRKSSLTKANDLLNNNG